MPELKGGIGKDGAVPRTPNKRLRERPVSYVMRAMLRLIARNGEGWAEDRVMQSMNGDPFPVWGDALAWAFALETHRELLKLEEVKDEALEGVAEHERAIATTFMAWRMHADMEAAVVEWDRRRERRAGLR